MTLDLRLSPRPPSTIARFSLTLACFAATVALYALALTRLQTVDGSAGFAALLGGVALAALAALLSLVGMVVVWKTGRRGGVRAMFALVIAAAVIGGPAFAAFRGYQAPSVAEVSTDLADPPRYDVAARNRGFGDLPAPGPTITPEQAAAQKAAYPDIAPLTLQLPPDEVANLVTGLVEERGWRVVGRTSYPRGGPPTGRVEAVARTLVLGLREDVVIRVRPSGDGSRVDMRSASRVRFADFGGNAERIRSFLADLATAANGAQ